VPGRDLEQRLRELPSVDELLRSERFRSAAGDAPAALSLEAARAAIERRRQQIRLADGLGDGLGDGLDGEADAAALADEAARELVRLTAPSFENVVNATGVVVHTNLGRAPLAAAAREAVERAGRGYSNLEYDLERGVRGSRHSHVEALIRELTGAEAAFAVNNNAAAVMLALAALARDREVVVSRGQLVEIGGSFRIPEILAASGARLVEVGTTNRTRLADYERAIGPDTAALMRVHASNFRTVGFTEEVAIDHLCRLGMERGVRTIDDLGSGVLLRSHEAGSAEEEAAERLERLAHAVADEPTARPSVEAGADVVCFSGDKLLGGPQAGLVAGRREAVERMRSHPMARALRLDKLSIAALEATLRLYREPARAASELPVLRMLSATEEELEQRALSIRDAVEQRAGERCAVEIVRVAGRVGGGALPLLDLEGPAVAVRARRLGSDELRARLRRHRPPVVARVNAGALVIDPRTMDDEDAKLAASAVAEAVSG
jgi:L-seryl-tRNA(Ser) seleniumtransferase